MDLLHICAWVGHKTTKLTTSLDAFTNYSEKCVGITINFLHLANYTILHATHYTILMIDCGFEITTNPDTLLYFMTGKIGAAH